MFESNDFQEYIDAEISGNRALMEKDPHRPAYHLIPPVGLLNDPNGLIQFKGVYHVYFQWNPFETKHGRKAWGHYTSEDLINWTLQPAALMPDKWYDKNGCYSGSAIEHEGKMYVFYTGNVKDEADRRSSYQCLAVSADGMNFEKKGPVLHLPDGYTPHFRDPKVWREGDHWLMVLGAQNEDGQGEAVLARSADLVDWEFLGPIAGSGINGLQDFGYMWECPDLFDLDGRDVLIVCPQGLGSEGDKYHNLFQAGYFLGAFDSADNEYRHGAFVEMDRGFDFYAPQTMTDDRGRRILIAWMGMTDASEQDQPTIDHNWIHALTIPRELEIREGRMVQSPVEELKALRGEVQHNTGVLREGETFRSETAACAEILIEFEHFEDSFEMNIRNDIKIRYEDKRFVIERTTFDGTGREKRAFTLDHLSSMHIFLEHSSIEIFINSGEEVCTCRFFPEQNENEIVLRGRGASVNISQWSLKTEGNIVF